MNLKVSVSSPSRCSTQFPTAGCNLGLPAAPTLAEFLNWMPSTEPPDDGAAEDIQESAEAALAATSQGI
jgi:hypothetical protein